MQFFLGLMVWFFHQNRILFMDSYELFKTYNITIILFNLLPIIPLDGSIIMHSLIEKKYPFECSFCFYEIVSCIFLVFFCFFNYFFQIDNYFICFVLFSEFLFLKRKKRYIIHRFYLERTIGNYPYKKIENEKIFNISSLKKETLHFYWKENKYVHEKEVLRRKLDRTYYIDSKK